MDKELQEFRGTLQLFSENPIAQRAYEIERSSAKFMTKATSMYIGGANIDLYLSAFVKECSNALPVMQKIDNQDMYQPRGYANNIQSRCVQAGVMLNKGLEGFIKFIEEEYLV